VSSHRANDVERIRNMSELTERSAVTARPESAELRRYLVLAICCMSLLIVSMDVTIVNVALPDIRSSLHASFSNLQWTIDAYTLVLASLLMLSGSTADRLGRRRTFQTGLVVFSLGSLLCSLAPNAQLLIVFRMVQAIGGSMLNPVAMSIITNVFTEPKERARAIGVWGAVVGISLAVGPVLGGLLTETIGWRAIFWINVPIGVLAFVLAAIFVPESKADRARRVDPVGQLLVIVILAGMVYAIIEGARKSWTSPVIVVAAVLAVLALVALLAYEPRRIDPLLDLRFFASVPFSGATVSAVCAFGAFSGFLFLNTLYLQDVRHLSALHAGLYTLPLAAMATLCSPFSGRWVAARGARVPLIVAGAAMTASALMLTQLRADSSTAYLIGAYLLFGLGFGVVNSPITNAAVSGMPRNQAGVAAAVASTSRQVGATLGVAVAGAIAGTSGSAVIGAGFSSATHPAWWAITGLTVAVIVLGVLCTGPWARGTADQTAARIAGDG
jgi:EmrB/QacA subfamily drug resistance transporter